MSESVVVLGRGRDVALRRFHPWVFSGAVERVDGSPELGSTVAVRSHDGEFLARGAYSPYSEIRVRAWTFRGDVSVDPEFFRARLRQAIEDRHGNRAFDDRAVRLVNAESDGLPGFVVDRYADVTVCQFLSAGASRWQDELVDLLQELLPAASVLERSDANARIKEGLAQTRGVLAGDPPPERVEVREGDWRFHVDVWNGHKTGFYLDQRDSRTLLRHYAPGADVLDVFSYTGAFGTAAAGSGARSLISVDVAEEVLDEARRHLEDNDVAHVPHETICGDAFEILRRLREERRTFDLIVLDPPKFVHGRNQLRRGARGYKDINLQAFQLLRPGGVLFTFSCSGHVDGRMFAKIVADAAADAGRTARILHRTDAPSDHPVALGFPEGRYLKGLVCRVEGSSGEPRTAGRPEGEGGPATTA